MMKLPKLSRRAATLAIAGLAVVGSFATFELVVLPSISRPLPSPAVGTPRTAPSKAPAPASPAGSAPASPAGSAPTSAGGSGALSPGASVGSGSLLSMRDPFVPVATGGGGPVSTGPVSTGPVSTGPVATGSPAQSGTGGTTSSGASPSSPVTTAPGAGAPSIQLLAVYTMGGQPEAEARIGGTLYPQLYVGTSIDGVTVSSLSPSTGCGTFSTGSSPLSLCTSTP